jgi:hypothetical protein
MWHIALRIQWKRRGGLYVGSLGNEEKGIVTKRVIEKNRHTIRYQNPRRVLTRGRDL